MIIKLKQIIIPLLFFITAIVITYFLIPDYHPFGWLNITSSKQSIIDHSYQYLNKAKILYESNKLNIKLESDMKFIRWINSEYKINLANKILSENDGSYYWVLNRSNKDKSSIVVSSDNEGNIQLNKPDFTLKILDNGKVIGFRVDIEDSTVKISLTPIEAKNLAENFIVNFRNDIVLEDDSLQISNTGLTNTFYFESSEIINKQKHNEYNFSWYTKIKKLVNYSLKVQIVGDQIRSFIIQPIIPENYQKEETDVFVVATTIIFLLLIVISVSIVGFKRFRAYEVGFKLAIGFGVLVIISFVLNELLEKIGSFDFTMLLGMGLGGIFISGAAVVLWAVSETLFREIWNPKYLSLDLIYHKKIIHSKIGVVLINSISFGFGLTAVFFVLQFALSNYSSISFYGDSFNSFSYITSSLPLLNIFLSVFNSYAILSVAFFMFLAASIKRYISNDIIFILVCGFAWALFIPSNVNPLTAGLPISLVIGILLSTILIKYDLLSTLLSFLLFKFFIIATEFSFLDESSLKNEWHILILIILILLVFGIVLILRKDKFTEYDSITPKFVENITERQRLKKELDVAKHVQMSFLPKENPSLMGIDIASTCIPALEVGGDYYDFIHLEKNKLGIIVGDVSGKGTQAAFYMTLTKGFLKAIAKTTDSPAEVLIKMNELFYENVERGRFISMIYAIVDLEKKLIRIARAGHNPVILNDHGNIKLISPTGLALGLEKGLIFSKVITETEEEITSGKTYLFYTDGFTEAVNKKGHEYGLDRMFEIVKLWNSSSAEQIKSRMIEDVNKFIGKASQHDDMTMVILKIK